MKTSFAWVAVAAAVSSQAEAGTTNLDTAFLSIPGARGSVMEALQIVKSHPLIRTLVRETGQTLNAVSRIENSGIETTKFQSFYRGLPVVGAQALHHKGLFRTTLTHRLAQFDLDTSPRLTAEDAAALANSYVSNLELAAAPKLQVLPGQDRHSARLVYTVKFKGSVRNPGATLWLNAHSGDLIAHVSDHMDIAPVEVYQVNDQCQSVDEDSGAPIGLQIAHCDHVVNKGKVVGQPDESATRAFNNATQVLNYFLTNHQRNSFDDKGSPSTNLVHIGKDFSNAFWSSDLKIMAYGDGDGVTMADFTRSLDVAGHEMTHGVVSETADLLYFDQSGALNESYADFFGKMVSFDADDWSIGKDLFIDRTTAKGIRNLADPNLHKVQRPDQSGVVGRPYPKHMDEIFTADGNCNKSSNDNCWVHVNSTIPSHAAYKVVKAIGKKKAERLYYVTLTQYLTSTSNFAAARDATLEACAELYDSATCSKVEASFAAVGL